MEKVPVQFTETEKRINASVIDCDWFQRPGGDAEIGWREGGACGMVRRPHFDCGGRRVF
jgi:hypothetical protein